LNLFVRRSTATVLACRRGLNAGALMFLRAPVRILCTRASRAPAHALVGARSCLWPPRSNPRRRSFRRTGALPLRVTFPY
jgi:hypothetical protein